MRSGRNRRQSVVWKAVALLLAALAITAAIFSFSFEKPRRASPRITVSAVSSFNSSGVVPGPTVTAPSKSLGGVAANRDIWLAISWKFSDEERELNAVTVGGVPARRLVRSNEVPDSANSEIWMVSAGTGDALENTISVDIAFTFDGGNPSITTQVYRVTGASEIPAVSAAAGRDFSISITIPNKGVALISLIAPGTTSGSLSNVTEDFNGLCGKDFLGIHASKKSTFRQSVTARFSGSATAAFAAVALRRANSRFSKS
ncbi:hypothetical protein [Mesorhizobium sp. LjNodule214]|uniref:hypothetical protein n=1 Tax=Mesorhizobium sp. LjNodule214 TaxID=3342252 RepID=UPI003ECE864E